MEINNYYQVYIAIALCAIVTYSIRIGGLLLADWLPETGKVSHFIEALPGTILVSFIAPDIVRNGISGIVASGIIVVLMYKTRSVFVSSSVGMLFIVLSRMIL